MEIGHAAIIIKYLLLFICLIPAIVFRKKIAYLFCPDEIYNKYRKNNIFVFFNLAPSLTIAITIVIRLREYLQSQPTLASFENYALVFGFLVFLISLFISGYITDKVLYYTDPKYKIWKDLGIIIEINDDKEKRGDFT